ncbi:Sec2p domain-containing protein, partial [Trichostrongylus colubriformis]
AFYFFIYRTEVSPCSPRGEEILRMRQELEAARRSIAEKDEKMCRLTRIQDTEAYRMVNYAEERRERSEKLLNESRLQVCNFLASFHILDPSHSELSSDE